MARAASTPSGTDLGRRLAAFAVERFPFAAPMVGEAFDAVAGHAARDHRAIVALRGRFDAELRRRLDGAAPDDVGETTPGVDARSRFRAAVDEVAQACDGFLQRAAVRASLTSEERREILRGMLLTRATVRRR